MHIESFAHKGLRRLYEDDDTSGVPAACVQKLRNQLGFLEAMGDVGELLNPVLRWKAHRLRGDRAGAWALHVTANWRLTFWVDERRRLRDLTLEDYH